MTQTNTDFLDDLIDLHFMADEVLARLSKSGQLYYAWGPTVEEQLLADMSSAARAACFGVWPGEAA